MMEPEGGSESEFGKIREKMDFSHWVLDHMEKMSDVQAIPDLRAYEHMLNTLIFRLSPWWPKEQNEDGKTFEDRLKEARGMVHKNPSNPKNRERLEIKELLLAELLDATGIAFTRRKRAKISGGLKGLWEAFPPFPKSKQD